jgi:hypothetical protein
MKLIGRVNGVVACREAPEEYAPDRPPPMQDVINLIRATYQFANFPIIQPGINLAGPFIFSAGRFSHEDKTFAIAQLIMLQGGDIVGTASTDDSELVINHLMALLDGQFGFRLAQANIKRSYLSAVVVEFDDTFSVYIEKIGRMELAINRLLPPDAKERRFKNFGFGLTDITGPTVILDQLSRIENADFSIERRAGQTFFSNRFYCLAPMRTDDHLRALEQIEEIARGDAT